MYLVVYSLYLSNWVFSDLVGSVGFQQIWEICSHFSFLQCIVSYQFFCLFSFWDSSYTHQTVWYCPIIQHQTFRLKFLWWVCKFSDPPSSCPTPRVVHVRCRPPHNHHFLPKPAQPVPVVSRRSREALSTDLLPLWWHAAGVSAPVVTMGNHAQMQTSPITTERVSNTYLTVTADIYRKSRFPDLKHHQKQTNKKQQRTIHNLEKYSQLMGTRYKKVHLKRSKLK